MNLLLQVNQHGTPFMLSGNAIGRVARSIGVSAHVSGSGDNRPLAVVGSSSQNWLKPIPFSDSASAESERGV